MSSQALRRLLHVGSVVILVIPLISSWDLLRVVVVLGTVLAVTLDLIRLKFASLRRRIADLVPVFRPAEDRRVSGATWLCAGYALAVLFPPLSPAAGILVGGLADPAASLVGSRTGGSGKKTVSGSLAALAVSLLALWLIGLPWPSVIGAAVVGTALERWPGPINDNLLVAPGVACVVWITA